MPYSIAWIDKQSHIGRNGGASGMGFTNFKAIAVFGTGKINVWDRDKLKTMASRFIREAMNTLLLNKSVATSALLLIDCYRIILSIKFSAGEITNITLFRHS
jgi:aldehyde:ferredoxin oxidoreductase